MTPRPHYEIYCLYHNKIFPKYYNKKQIDQVTFVKMDKGPYVFKSKKHINLQKESWFHSIGKEWVEYEFYYSLYKGYLENKVELPEYMGFIQYDMEFKGREKKYKNTSIIDFVEDLIQKKQLHEKTLISFQPHSFKRIYDQNFVMDPDRPHITVDPYYENCIVTILRECNQFLYQNKTIHSLQDNVLNLCGAFFVHKGTFIKMMEFLSVVIEDRRLDIFNKKERHQGILAERYITIFFEFLDVHKIEFDIHHLFLATLDRSARIVGVIGKILKVRVPKMYKFLKPYFPDKGLKLKMYTVYSDSYQNLFEKYFKPSLKKIQIYNWFQKNDKKRQKITGEYLNKDYL